MLSMSAAILRYYTSGSLWLNSYLSLLLLSGLNVGVAYTLERSNSGRSASAKAAFESTVRKEFNRLMAEGGCSPNEAAAQAIRAAAAVKPSAA